MRAGELRHRVKLQKYTASNVLGEVTRTWRTEPGQRWAAIEPQSGSETFDSSKQVQGKVTHRIRLRYVEGLRPEDRILFGSRVFAIHSVVNVDERGRETHCMCEEVP